MFLKKLFGLGKDYNHYLDKGDRYMADGQYAYARGAYTEALEKLGSDSADQAAVEDLCRKIARSGDMLGRMNLTEAEHAVAAGDMHKAADHLDLVLELAEDPELRGRAESMLAGLDGEPVAVQPSKSSHNCVSCKGVDALERHDQVDDDEDLSPEDRLALHFHSLPEDLPERYAAMGGEFASACLLRLEGDGEGALRLFRQLEAGSDNDIICYEMAILHYENGDFEKSEELLIRAIGLNALNPLSNIGLVHLYNETGRGEEALKVLQNMIANDVMPEQTTLMLGDQYAMLRDESNAIENYSRLLVDPRLAKEAAVRIVPILQRQGRTEEAAFLLKKYAKGCC